MRVDPTMALRAAEIDSELRRLPPDQREAWLRAQNLDPSLAELVRNLAQGSSFSGALGGSSRILSKGSKIGEYELVEELGEGGFGVVWRARKPSEIVPQEVAIKLPKQILDVESVKQEARLWHRASYQGHKHILPILGADVTPEGQVYIVSIYAHEGSLARRPTQWGSGVPAMADALDIACGVLDGLAHLHALGILHRDLKPSNILFHEGTPRIADFGLARVLPSMASRPARSTFVGVAGTLEYMAPEAFDGARTVQTDLWSAGVMLFELLAGHLPFRGPRTAIQQVVRSRHPEPLPASVPPAIQAVVFRALQKDPQYRYSSASDMLAALNAARHSLGTALLAAASRPSPARGEVSRGPVASPSFSTSAVSVGAGAMTGAVPSRRGTPTTRRILWVGVALVAVACVGVVAAVLSPAAVPAGNVSGTLGAARATSSPPDVPSDPVYPPFDVPTGCSPSEIILFTNSNRSYHWPLARQTFLANPHIPVVNRPPAAGQVQLVPREWKSSVALVARCGDAPTCNQVASMFKTLVRASNPQPVCSKGYLGAPLPSGFVWHSDPKSNLPSATDTAAQCARLNACQLMARPSSAGDPFLECQKRPHAFKTACALKYPCSAVMACLGTP